MVTWAQFWLIVFPIMFIAIITFSHFFFDDDGYFSITGHKYKDSSGDKKDKNAVRRLLADIDDEIRAVRESGYLPMYIHITLDYWQMIYNYEHKNLPNSQYIDFVANAGNEPYGVFLQNTSWLNASKKKIATLRNIIVLIDNDIPDFFIEQSDYPSPPAPKSKPGFTSISKMSARQPTLRSYR